MTTAILCSALLARAGLRARRQRVPDAGVTGKAGGYQMPTDPASRLLIAIRAHGNAAEYVPVLIVLFLLVGARSPAWVAIPLIVVATVARLLHAYGMLTTHEHGHAGPAAGGRGRVDLPDGRRPGRRRRPVLVMSGRARWPDRGCPAPQSGLPPLPGRPAAVGHLLLGPGRRGLLGRGADRPAGARLGGGPAVPAHPVLGPWLGAVVDRHDRRVLLLLAEAGLGVVALGYAVAAVDLDADPAGRGWAGRRSGASSTPSTLRPGDPWCRCWCPGKPARAQPPSPAPSCCSG